MQARPWTLAIVSLAVMIALLTPVFAMRLTQRRRERPGQHEHTPRLRPSRQRLRSRIQRPAAARRGATGPRPAAALPALRAAVSATPTSSPSRRLGSAPSGNVAVIQAFPDSAPQAQATTNLVNHLRSDVLPAFEHRTGVPVLVGGFTAGSIDFSNVLSSKLPLFIGIVVLLSALLLFVIFRSLVIPVQAAMMNLLTIGGALGVTVLSSRMDGSRGCSGCRKPRSNRGSP